MFKSKQTIAEFNISKDERIEFYFPDIENKINYFYEPTTILHKFDEIIGTYHNKKKNITVVVYKDVLDAAFLGLAGQIKDIIQKKIELPPYIRPGTLTFCLNESNIDNPEELYDNIDFSRYWVWSMISGGAQTFMYTVDNVLYLEIGCSYKWHTQDPEASDTDFISYEEFKKNYQPILVTQISDETARRWLEICNFVLEEIS